MSLSARSRTRVGFSRHANINRVHAEVQVQILKANYSCSYLISTVYSFIFPESLSRLATHTH